MLPVTSRPALPLLHTTVCMYLNMGMMGSPIRRQFPDESRAAVSTAEPHAMEKKRLGWAVKTEIN